MTATLTDIQTHVLTVSEKTKWTFIEVTLSDGMIGFGEATAFRKEAEVVTSAKNFQQQLQGFSEERLQEFCANTQHLNFAQQAVISALNQAIWDIKGKRAGQPVYELFGKPYRQTIPIYANINRRCKDRSVQGFYDNAQDAAAYGFDTIKIAPFDGLEPEMESDGDALFQLGIDRIAASCDAIGPDVNLMVDCHWRLNHERSHQLFSKARDLGLYWVECPLPENPEDISNLKALKPLKDEFGIRLAGAERGTSNAYFDAVMDADLYDVIMPDIKYAGGIDGLLRIAKSASDRGVSFSPHNPSGPLSHAASLHLCASISNLLILEHQFGESPMFTEMCPGTVPEIKNGKSMLPSGTGLNFSL